MTDLFDFGTPQRRVPNFATYTAERRAFSRLKSDCSEESKLEYESAIAVLIERYNTTIYENRFIVGGAVEVFTFALLRSVGLDCTLYGDQAKSGDILLPNDKKLSVKGAFTGGATDIRLLNKQGGGERYWDTATLFVISEVGIIYGTPDMVSGDDVEDVSDAVVLRRRGLLSLMKDENNVFEMNICKKPPTEMTGFSLKASTAVAKQILVETNSDNLVRAITIGVS